MNNKLSVNMNFVEDLAINAFPQSNYIGSLGVRICISIGIELKNMRIGNCS